MATRDGDVAAAGLLWADALPRCEGELVGDVKGEPEEGEAIIGLWYRKAVLCSASM